MKINAKKSIVVVSNCCCHKFSSLTQLFQMSPDPFHPQGCLKPLPYRFLPIEPWGSAFLLLVFQGPSFASLSAFPPGEGCAPMSVLTLCTLGSVGLWAFFAGFTGFAKRQYRFELKICHLLVV